MFTDDENGDEAIDEEEEEINESEDDDNEEEEELFEKVAAEIACEIRENETALNLSAEKEDDKEESNDEYEEEEEDEDDDEFIEEGDILNIDDEYENLPTDKEVLKIMLEEFVEEALYAGYDINEKDKEGVNIKILKYTASNCIYYWEYRNDKSS
ncbi:hypothetical protein TRFO_15836 [Tritrichomonas foetus]|uniref:Uncharacterized protein n=1 Tax=Tritrichomonas foetus TaxID=1144522 RepID=A0A1J4KW62_9EUKA|nr:hypothetical protein TRFO_15836 [Tritrichomonas foetus]|eukprot:OHT13934.1 hypothetical protein TRFO_15836 [Tritrichomonas foetus]